MENRSQSRRPDIDFRSGFEITWQHKRDNCFFYMLVKVPKKIPYGLTYKKSDLSVDIALTPMSSFSWEVSGILGADAMVKLGMEVSEPRQDGYHPPIITEENVEQIKKRGIVADLSNNRTRLYVNIIVPEIDIDRFLNKVWREPQDKVKWDSEYHVPHFFLKGDYLTIPQKIILARGLKPSTTLTVVKR